MFTKEKNIMSGVLVAASPVTAYFGMESFHEVGFQLKCASHTSGNGVFTFEGTINGIDWVALNVLVTNVTNTNAQNLTRVASVTLNSNTTALVFLEPVACLKTVRVVCTITTDGAYSVDVIAKG